MVLDASFSPTKNSEYQNDDSSAFVHGKQPAKTGDLLTTWAGFDLNNDGDLSKILDGL